MPIFRIVLIIGVAAVAVAAGVEYLMLFPPLPLLPEIARGLPSQFSDGETEFQRRVDAKFSGLTTETELVASLRKEGFAIDPVYRRAEFEKTKFPCKLSWRIFWEVDGGSVANLIADYRGICL